ncbi:laccase-7-like isoform X1 [Neltuma alba]|uniref:laccase-7-like isoform X1 n=1 Tax=Neltuma alba TaxID=207710 RepID=UPI0010A5765A|nr:laccase-7-like isoform X1 [Prosopis alba]
MRTSSLLSLAWTLALLASSSSLVSADVVEYTWEVANVTMQRLCEETEIAAVNGMLPGPTINVREGDTVIVHAVNKSPYNLTIHWHGILQLMSQWADGPEFVTQCAILPGRNYTYRFNVTQQEGTLWWHAHSSFLRAWVYGALIIRPRLGNSYPFPTPHQEVPIVLGEWWNANVIEVEEEAVEFGGAPNISDAFTINGLPGALYNCSQNQTFRFEVQQGNTYLLRIINAALNEHLFFKIASHTFTVVAVDAAYTNHYHTDIIVVAPGQTVDALLTANQTVGSYFMAATPYSTLNESVTPVADTTTVGIVVYNGSTSTTPLMPILPVRNDTQTANNFYLSITGLAGGPHWVPVPEDVNEHMFITVGLALDFCNLPNDTCRGPAGLRLSSSMNNESFVLPSGRGLSMLDAFYRNATTGVYTKDFPDNPPLVFDYTDPSLNNNLSLAFAPKSTKVKTLRFNSTVQIVFQNTAILAAENHPMHIHGFNFHVLAQGTGNYNASRDESQFNLVDPQIRNTVAVPFAGWSVVRFQANNPGIWLVHCHIDNHLSWGLTMAFEVENGPTPETTLPPPPADLPTQC